MSSTALDRLRAYFADAPGDVLAAYVFGSEARGEARPGSDVDVGVLLGRRPPATLLAQPYALADELQGVLGRRVDVVVLDTAPPDLLHRVLRDGILVLDRDRTARIRFEVAARNAYFDLKPFLDRYRRSAA
jgi:predicted nucleotidyltransferase